jgi:predicted Zn-ribbon and HTH transcriptional regulator
MPVLTMTSRATCTLCGGRIDGVYVATWRINKRSMRSGDGGLIMRDPHCRHCGFEAWSVPERWVLTTEDQAKVNAYREKRGWR